MTELRSIRTTVAAFEDGSRSAVDIAHESIAAAERSNPSLRSFITVTAEHALTQARQADARRTTGCILGPLDGVPYAAKDMFETSGIRTTCGSRLLQTNVPETTAVAIRKLDAAGACLIGKTNLHEFAYGATGENGWAGTVVNPHDETRLAGGSSSGSAAAVAAGIVPFALGTDTGGSVRVPAALCGITGYKPSFGLISLDGVFPYCWSLDHAGVLTTCVEDLTTVARHIAMIPPALPPKGLRVGLVQGWEHKCEASVRGAFLAAKSHLLRSGATFAVAHLPDQAEARTVSLTIQLAETLTYHGPNLARARDHFGADMRSGMVLAQFISAESYIQCKRMLETYRRAFVNTMKAFDVLLTPACPITAPKIGTLEVRVAGQTMPIGNALTLFTSFFNLVGAPALVLPVSLQSRGLPVAVQLVGAPGSDAELFEIALMLERMLG
ncbi:MAG: amidase [Mesorhizobium sp.]|nr:MULTISPECIES: amidase [unclassified Mesorhizobium]RUV94693.1 amidase [Mesorhizobium sp. M1A.F.Ca.IN.020.04.1.1]RUW08198.1 amidase [Mesorhizobium sp. M1A.F.Ca.IN.020.03.1.1]RWF67926.1 MAG: amidase [Mesorhizobium sp.]RWG09931.1 MAG: amidase [Mesorhizobium sp.]RWG25169.1 MAG: amidase [Mesorhizobium sp.]